MRLIMIHRYLGLLLSIIVCVVSLSGTLLLWKKEFLWLDFVDARQSIDTTALAKAITRIETRYPVNDVVFIQLYSEDLSLHKVYLRNRHYAWHNQQGQQLEVWSGNGRFESWLLDVHHRFLLGNSVGLQIAGFSGLLLMALLVIGLCIWWSRRRTLRLGLLPNSMKRGVLMRSHGNIGAVFSWPIFMLGLTGVILVYPSQSSFVLVNAFGDDAPPVKQLESFDVSNGLPDWQSAITSVYKRFPGAQIRSVSPSTYKQPMASQKASLSIGFQQAGGWHRLGQSSITYRHNGQLIIKDELQQPRLKRVFDFSYPLHTAKLGLFYKCCLTLVGLAMLLLSLLGLMSYAKRV